MIAFSPDGTESCFGVMDSQWSTCDLYTDQIDDGGSISADGKYFFFNRRKAWITQKQTEMMRWAPPAQKG